LPDSDNSASSPCVVSEFGMVIIHLTALAARSKVARIDFSNFLESFGNSWKFLETYISSSTQKALDATL
jgi:hypothetical protein